MSYLPESRFSDEERRSMLALARAAIAAALEGKPLRRQMPPADYLSSRQGVFVTIHVQGKLRGCIGVVEPEEPLGESIAHCAQSAAFRDPRFPSLRRDELPSLQIEISLLSRPQPIAPDQIEIGRHGLLLAVEDRRGLLLPQVATEHHLSREEFLDETCRKAGLPRDTWRDRHTQILGFTCEIFQETAAAASG